MGADFGQEATQYVTETPGFLMFFHLGFAPLGSLLSKPLGCTSFSASKTVDHFHLVLEVGAQ